MAFNAREGVSLSSARKRRQEAPPASAHHRGLTVEKADGRCAVEPVDDVDAAVALFEAEARAVGHLWCVAQDGADHSAVTDYRDDLACIAFAYRGDRVQHARVSVLSPEASHGRVVFSVQAKTFAQTFARVS